MAPDVFQILVQSKQANVHVTHTQMIATTDFVSRL